MKSKLLVISVVMLLMFGINAQQDSELPTVNPQLVEGNNHFALNFYQALPRSDDANLLFSPYSISQAFAMAYAGAQGNTATQMADTMSFNMDQSLLHDAFGDLNTNLTERTYEMPDGEGKGFTLNIANALWGQIGYPFDPNYIDTIDTYYGGGFREVDFINDPSGTTDAINNWVEEKTEDRIQDILQPGVINEMTRMVIANAIYFNASWFHAFTENLTQDDTFTTLDGTQVTVPMMKQMESFLYAEGDGYQVVELPYFGNDTAMLIILPEEGQFDEIDSQLNLNMYNTIVSSLAGGEQINLSVPKFEYEFEASLSPMLIRMGMQDAFDGSLADFNGMATDMPDGNLFISDALHKAFIKVDEAGTEAAAATVLVMRATSAMPAEPIEFRVDRPFIFVIRDQITGSILFIGHVVDPTTG